MDAPDLPRAVHHRVVAVEDADIGPLGQRAGEMRHEIGAQLGGGRRHEHSPAGRPVPGGELAEPAPVDGTDLRVEG